MGTFVYICFQHATTMPSPTTDELYEQAIQLLHKMYPAAETKTLRLQVPPSRQQKEIQLLAETIRFDRFFFSLNLLTKQIEHAHGIAQYLGYDNPFTFRTYFDIIHPNHLFALNARVGTMLTITNTSSVTLAFGGQRYVTTIALRHKAGYYVQVKCTLSPFQFDQYNRLTAYLSEFTIVSEIDTHQQLPDLQPRVIDLSGRRPDLEEKVRHQVVSNWQDDPGAAPFSFQQIRILRKLAYGGPDLTQEEIATSLKITTGTLQTHLKRSLKKGRVFFNQHFTNAIELAIYLRNNGIL
jgi:DNA-binding CsgD family transcriptional regulator